MDQQAVFDLLQLHSRFCRSARHSDECLKEIFEEYIIISTKLSFYLGSKEKHITLRLYLCSQYVQLVLIKIRKKPLQYWAYHEVDHVRITALRHFQKLLDDPYFRCKL